MYYTYVHYKKGTKEPFYIGKGSGKRLYRKDGRNQYWINVYNKYGRDSEILAYWETQQEAYEHEKLLIQCFKDLGFNLTNVLDGGEGNHGFPHTEETKRKISESKIGINNPNYFRTGLLSPCLKYIVKATEIDTGEITFLVGSRDMKAKGFSHGKITEYFRGIRKSHKNHIFEKIVWEGLE